MDGASTDDDVAAMRAWMKPEERLRGRREMVATHRREWHLSTKQIADYLGLPARYVEQTLQEAGRIGKAGRGGIEDEEAPVREAATDPSGSPPSPSTPRPSG
jgi:hypothetical protein